MNPKIEKWLQSLESGKYKQNRGSLSNPHNCRMCCIGVYHHVINGADPQEMSTDGGKDTTTAPYEELNDIFEQDGVRLVADDLWHWNDKEHRRFKTIAKKVREAYAKAEAKA
jgi:hypothetical protein